jgi:hypothetical protein
MHFHFLPKDLVEYLKHFLITFLHFFHRLYDVKIVCQFCLFNFFVTLRQHVIWIFRKSAIKLTNHLCFLKVNLIWIVEQICAAAFTGRDASELLEKKAELSCRWNMWVSYSRICKATELKKIFFKSKIC